MSKVTLYDAITAWASGDILYVVSNPGGTPSSKKMTIDDAFENIIVTTNVWKASATALTVSRGAGVSYYALQVDTSAGSAATGIKITSAAAAGGVAISAISSGANENLALDAKGSGTVTIGATSTGQIGLSQTAALSKNLVLPVAIGATVGVICKASTRFLHDYCDPAASGSNLFIGLNSGNFTMAKGGGDTYLCSYNLGMGENALGNLTTGYQSVCVGRNAGAKITTAYGCVAVGVDCLSSQAGAGSPTTSYSVSAVGQKAGYSLVSGNDDSFFGFEAAMNLIDGGANSIFGVQGMHYTVHGDHNCVVGAKGMADGASHSYCNTVGNYAGKANAADYLNAHGYSAAYANTSGVGVCAFGHGTLYTTTTADYPSGFGHNALQNSNANMACAFGAFAGQHITSGHYPTIVGYEAGLELTTAVGVTVVGCQAWHTARVGDYSTLVGYQSGFGAGAGTSNLQNVTAVGALALYAISSGANDTAIGMSCLQAVTTATGASGLGVGAGNYVTTATAVTCVGYYAGAGGSAAEGVTTEDYCTFFGANACLVSGHTGTTNMMALGYNAQVYYSNSVVIGNTNVTMTILRAKAGVGLNHPTQVPLENLQVADGVAISSTDEGNVGRLTRRTVRQVVTLSGATTDSTINIPSGCLLLGVSFCVDTAVVDDGGDNTWSAAYIGGSTATLTTGAAAAKQTKVNTLIVPALASAETNVRFTPNGGSFTSGAIELVCFYEQLTSLADAA